MEGYLEWDQGGGSRGGGEEGEGGGEGWREGGGVRSVV